MADRSTVFADLLLQSSRPLFGFIYSLVQNLSDAEDIYQETALVLWRKFDEFTPGTNFTAWAMRVARLSVLKQVSAKRKERLYFSDELIDSIAQTCLNKVEGERGLRASVLENCLEKLADKDKKLIAKCYAPDRNYSEIASSEGRTLNSLYQAVSRIRKSLFECVERTVALESR
jgi:RNA polymerase sigma-70 factor (ECF subfamily)